MNMTETVEEEVAEIGSVPPHFFIGVFLVTGFILMFIVDQIGSYCSYHGEIIQVDFAEPLPYLPTNINLVAKGVGVMKPT